MGACHTKKGADEEAYAARLLADDLRWMGHAKIILRYDNEKSLKSLAKQMINILHEDAPTPIIDDPGNLDGDILHKTPLAMIRSQGEAPKLGSSWFEDFSVQ